MDTRGKKSKKELNYKIDKASYPVTLSYLAAWQIHLYPKQNICEKKIKPNILNKLFEKRQFGSFELPSCYNHRY